MTAVDLVRADGGAPLTGRRGRLLTIAAWALLGELPRDELLRLAHRVYQALQP